MKIILQDLKISKVYTFKLIEDKTVLNGYVDYAGLFLNNEKSIAFEYNNITSYKYIKIISETTWNEAPYARFINSNGELIGNVISYVRSGEYEVEVPANADKFQVNDNWGGYGSNSVSVYGKIG